MQDGLALKGYARPISVMRRGWTNSYMPWLWNTFLQPALSFVRFCCKHCWTAPSSPNCLRQKREASREHASCSRGVPGRSCAKARPGQSRATIRANFDIGLSIGLFPHYGKQDCGRKVPCNRLTFCCRVCSSVAVRPLAVGCDPKAQLHELCKAAELLSRRAVGQGSVHPRRRASSDQAESGSQSRLSVHRTVRPEDSLRLA